MVMTRRLRPLEECSQSIPAREVKEIKPGDSVLEMQVLHRNLNSGKEVVGFSWFKRVGPYPDPIPLRKEEEAKEEGEGLPEAPDGDRSGSGFHTAPSPVSHEFLFVVFISVPR